MRYEMKYSNCVQIEYILGIITLRQCQVEQAIPSIHLFDPPIIQIKLDLCMTIFAYSEVTFESLHHQMKNFLYGKLIIYIVELIFLWFWQYR